MKLVLNPTFAHLRPLMEQLPSLFEGEGTTLYKGRNELKVFHTDGVALCVKSYRTPIWINRVAYTLFRASKAQRAYDYGKRLLTMGVETPTPIAYIEVKHRGLYTKGYFVSTLHPTAQTLNTLTQQPLAECAPLLKAFVSFTYRLHQLGIEHLDYSLNNVLYTHDIEQGYQLSLIDTNRMRFRPLNQRDALRNFARIAGEPPLYAAIAKEYALLSGGEEGEILAEILRARAAFLRHKERSNTLKQLTTHV